MPVNVSVVVEGCALLVNVSAALAVPVTVGLKVTVKLADWPAGKVSGSDSPPTLNTELLVLAAVTVTLVPLAVNDPVAVPLVPTTTFPRGSVVGATVKTPVAVVPVPERGTVSVGLEAVDVSVRFPLAAPADVGANETVKVALCPEVSVTGVVIPLKLNPVPLAAT